MKPGIRALLATVFVAAALPGARAQEAPASGVLFENVRIFDGRGTEVTGPANVLVTGDVIARISAEPIAAGAGVTVIAGEGRTLMPGLIDAHAHLMMGTVPLGRLMTAEPEYITLMAGKDAGEMLLRGFTSARDVGGPVFGLKRAIDQGAIPGPRIWPSGAMVSQTSGHGDFRSAVHDLPGRSGTHFSERFGFAAIADGRDEVLRAVREQLMRGANFVKLMAGGGVSSMHDPLDSTQYTEDELRAAVEAAANWGTYVAVHAYTPEAIQQAIRAGVKVIEHGHLADAEAARIMAENDVWWSLQPFLDDEDAIPFPEGSDSRAMQLEIVAGTDSAYALAKEHGVRTAFGTDTLFDARLATRQGAQLAKLVRWYSPGEVLRMATGDNAELLALSGPRNPYPGRLGVIEEGALADLILVDGDPVAEIALIADPGANFLVIMKGGTIYKNTAG